jgi:hypothetical protein
VTIAAHRNRLQLSRAFTFCDGAPPGKGRCVGGCRSFDDGARASCFLAFLFFFVFCLCFLVVFWFFFSLLWFFCQIVYVVFVVLSDCYPAPLTFCPTVPLLDTFPLCGDSVSVQAQCRVIQGASYLLAIHIFFRDSHFLRYPHFYSDSPLFRQSHFFRASPLCRGSHLCKGVTLV